MPFKKGGNPWVFRTLAWSRTLPRTRTHQGRILLLIHRPSQRSINFRPIAERSRSGKVCWSFGGVVGSLDNPNRPSDGAGLENKDSSIVDMRVDAWSPQARGNIRERCPLDSDRRRNSPSRTGSSARSHSRDRSRVRNRLTSTDDRRSRSPLRLHGCRTDGNNHGRRNESSLTELDLELLGMIDDDGGALRNDVLTF
jgi:hypothetical protein